MGPAKAQLADTIWTRRGSTLTGSFSTAGALTLAPMRVSQPCAASLFCVTLALGAGARADDAPATEQARPTWPKGTRRALRKRRPRGGHPARASHRPGRAPFPAAAEKLGAYVETLYQWNFNRPSNRITNYRGFDNRHDTFTLANVALDAQWDVHDIFGA